MVVLAQRVTGSAHDADEIVQDAFLKMWTMAPRWRFDGSATFATWLYRVVLNGSLDRRRRAPFAPLEEAGDPADPAPGGLEAAVTRQRQETIAACLAELPHRQGEALVLHYFGELTAPQAAEVLQLSLSAVEALLVRGKRSLKKAPERRGISRVGDIA